MVGDILVGGAPPLGVPSLAAQSRRLRASVAQWPVTPWLAVQLSTTQLTVAVLRIPNATVDGALPNRV
jgi:hypothetical protein